MGGVCRQSLSLRSRIRHIFRAQACAYVRTWPEVGDDVSQLVHHGLSCGPVLRLHA